MRMIITASNVMAFLPEWRLAPGGGRATED